jgi:hypothetical protein
MHDDCYVTRVVGVSEAARLATAMVDVEVLCPGCRS